MYTYIPKDKYEYTYIYIYIYAPYILTTKCNLYIIYLSIYNFIFIFQIAVTNIISLTAGISVKYNNQMVRNNKPTIVCYENTISTSSNLKNIMLSFQHKF